MVSVDWRFEGFVSRSLMEPSGNLRTVIRIGGIATAATESTRKMISVFIGGARLLFRGQKLDDVNRDVPVGRAVADNHDRRFPRREAEFSEADEALFQRRGDPLVHG